MWESHRSQQSKVEQGVSHLHMLPYYSEPLLMLRLFPLGACGILNAFLLLTGLHMDPELSPVAHDTRQRSSDEKDRQMQVQEVTMKGQLDV